MLELHVVQPLYIWQLVVVCLPNSQTTLNTWEREREREREKIAQASIQLYTKPSKLKPYISDLISYAPPPELVVITVRTNEFHWRRCFQEKRKRSNGTKPQRDDHQFISSTRQKEEQEEGSSWRQWKGKTVFSSVVLGVAGLHEGQRVHIELLQS